MSTPVSLKTEGSRDENVSSLTWYITDVLFENFKKDRGPKQQKWQRNIDAVKANVNGEFWKIGEASDWRSKTFIQITKMKVMAAWAIIVDMYLQNGQVPFDIIPSPWSGIVLDQLEPDARKQIDQDINDQKILIKQQLLDCNADRVLMKNIMASAIMGETIGKNYVHDVERTGFRQQSYAYEGMEDPQGQYARWEPYVETVTSPAWGYVSNWNFFYDIDNDDLQSNQGCIERDYISAYELARKKGKYLYIDSAIDRVIKAAEKPGSPQTIKDKETLPPGARDIKNRFRTIRRLECWGRAPKHIIEEFEKELEKEGKVTTDGEKPQEDPRPFNIEQLENTGDEIEFMAVVCDNEIVRYGRQPEKQRPYDRALWETDLDDNQGISVADNCESTQMPINGMVRAFEDNKKLSANVILGAIKRLLPDWDGELKPGVIPVSAECEDIRQAFSQVVIQDVGETLLSGIALMERFCDEVTLLPRIMQGTVAEKQKPDTLGELSILQNNAGKYLGGVLKNHDEGLVEPKINAFLRYNMMDPNQQKGKGDFCAKSIGFGTYQNRIVRMQKNMQALSLALMDPETKKEIKFRPLLETSFSAMDLDTTKILKTDDEKKKESQAMQDMQQQAMITAMQQMGAQMRMQLESALEEIKAKSDATINEIKAKSDATINEIKVKQDAELEKIAFQDRLKPEEEKEAGNNASAQQ